MDAHDKSLKYNGVNITTRFETIIRPYYNLLYNSYNCHFKSTTYYYIKGSKKKTNKTPGSGEIQTLLF